MPKAQKVTKKTTRRTVATTPEGLRGMISEAAYYLAEQRGFDGGGGASGRGRGKCQK